MGSPVPRNLRSKDEVKAIPLNFRDHRTDLIVKPPSCLPCKVAASRHPAKYLPGLPTALIHLAGTDNVGDPMAGTGRIAEETGLGTIALNDIDPRWRSNLDKLRAALGCEVSIGDATRIQWQRDVLIFSPPYYPRTDRKKQASHDDEARGSVVGFRTGYGCDEEGFIGDPSGVNGILIYRNAMRRVFLSLLSSGRRMILISKNWTRLGTELRLDLDLIITAGEAGWVISGRTGWEPRKSLWARYNASRGTPGGSVEDVLVFDRRESW